MKLLNNNLKLGFALVATLFFFTACENDTEPANTSATEDLDAKIKAKPELSILQAALEKTRLTTFTMGGGPFTIFAPNNAAFNAIGINGANDLSVLDSNLLVQILTYHIQATRRSYVEIPLGPNANMVTQGGLTQYASRKLPPGKTIAYINGVAVVEPDIVASNGYLHVIDQVLIPPLLTTAQTLANVPNYARFYQALVRTSTSTTINPLTIFAVDNASMIAAGYDSTSIADASGAVLSGLTAIMKYHTVNKRIFLPDLSAGPLKTMQGGTILVAGVLGSQTVQGNNNTSALPIVGGNLVTTTGVIHGISGLLKP